MNAPKIITLAGLVLAGTAFAQTEQWLTYHTGVDGRSYQSIKLTTNAPPGVALPKLTAPPYFARWVTPLDADGGRWMCFDRTRKTGPYDRLFLDRNGNGRLDDETAISAKLDSNYGNFPPTPVVFKGEDGPVTYHLIFRFYQYEKNPAQLLASSAGWYEGMVDFGGTKRRLQLIDGNVNGTFNDMAVKPSASDRIQVDGDKVGERFLGRMLEVDGKFFHLEVARDGAFVKVQPAKDIAFGTVRVPENISTFAAFGTNGHFVRQPVKGEFTLPSGSYQVLRWTINRKDEKGAAWTMSGASFPKTYGFVAAADQPSALEIGEPVKAVLTTTERGNRQVTFNLKFVGRQNETVDLMRGNERPPKPKLMLTAADGTVCYTNTFEYG